MSINSSCSWEAACHSAGQRILCCYGRPMFSTKYETASYMSFFLHTQHTCLYSFCQGFQLVLAKFNTWLCLRNQWDDSNSRVSTNHRNINFCWIQVLFSWNQNEKQTQHQTWNNIPSINILWDCLDWTNVYVMHLTEICMSFTLQCPTLYI